MTTEGAVSERGIESPRQQEDFSVKASNWRKLQYCVVIPVVIGGGDISGCAGAAPNNLPSSVLEWRKRRENHFIPKTDLGKKLLALRHKYIAEGGKLYSSEEIEQEIARRRGEA